jgi:uracil-DNA glycosylase
LGRTLSWIDNELYVLVDANSANHFFEDKYFAELIFYNQEINGKKVLVLPHTAPLNIKWFKDHSELYRTRLSEIRRQIQKVLDGNNRIE